MTKKLLDGYKKLKREILSLEHEIHEMETTDKNFGNDTIFDYRSGYPVPNTVIAFDREKYYNRVRALWEKQKEAKAVEGWVDAIEDAEIRGVFKMRYIEGMDWAKIAEKTGFASSPDYPRLYIRDIYLKKMDIF